MNLANSSNQPQESAALQTAITELTAELKYYLHKMMSVTSILGALSNMHNKALFDCEGKNIKGPTQVSEKLKDFMYVKQIDRMDQLQYLFLSNRIYESMIVLFRNLGKLTDEKNEEFDMDLLEILGYFFEDIDYYELKEWFEVCIWKVFPTDYLEELDEGETREGNLEDSLSDLYMAIDIGSLIDKMYYVHSESEKDTEINEVYAMMSYFEKENEKLQKQLKKQEKGNKNMQLHNEEGFKLQKVA